MTKTELEIFKYAEELAKQTIVSVNKITQVLENVIARIERLESRNKISNLKYKAKLK